MALRDISLIPPAVIERRYLRRHLGFWAGCLIVWLTLVAGIYLYLSLGLSAEARTTAGLTETQARVESAVKEITRIQAELDRIRLEQSVLDTVSSSPPYSLVLWRLAQAINKNTWLARLTVDRREDQKPKTAVQMVGYSYSNDDLGDFLDRLSTDQLFGSVVLKYSREDTMTQVEATGEKRSRQVQFQINCEIPGGSEASAGKL